MYYTVFISLILVDVISPMLIVRSRIDNCNGMTCSITKPTCATPFNGSLSVRCLRMDEVVRGYTANELLISEHRHQVYKVYGVIRTWILDGYSGWRIVDNTEHYKWTKDVGGRLYLILTRTGLILVKLYGCDTSYLCTGTSVRAGITTTATFKITTSYLISSGSRDNQSIDRTTSYQVSPIFTATTATGIIPSYPVSSDSYGMRSIPCTTPYPIPPVSTVATATWIITSLSKSSDRCGNVSITRTTTYPVSLISTTAASTGVNMSYLISSSSRDILSIIRTTPYPLSPISITTTSTIRVITSYRISTDSYDIRSTISSTTPLVVSPADQHRVVDRTTIIYIILGCLLCVGVGIVLWVRWVLIGRRSRRVGMGVEVEMRSMTSVRSIDSSVISSSSSVVMLESLVD